VRILLDECVPEPLRRSLPEHECQTVQKAGLSGRKNGELLGIAEELGYHVLLTVDRNLPYQQRIEGRSIAVLILMAHSNKLKDLMPLLPDCIEALRHIERGQVIRVRLPSAI
jgi:hypothetical protein